MKTYQPYTISRDHPRSRGVYDASSHRAASSAGSSPLARGLHSSPPRGPAGAGIIPARAGFTGWSRRGRRRWGAHPRSRGVYPSRPGRPSGSRGSSPLARGLPRRAAKAAGGAGIIPARAGFTGRSRSMCSRRWDHPRSRGVYLVGGPLRERRRGIIPARAGFTQGAALPGHGHLGSSPLARGLRGRVVGVVGGLGIIPARAGFTRGGRPTFRGRWDHPRSRGVYLTARNRPGAPGGSSPLARGLPQPDGRLTWTTWDHPRSRGVYRTPSGGPVRWRGSSPLARGLPVGQPRHPVRRRIIPARAGFTRWRRGGRRRRRDHPRSRGVYRPPSTIWRPMRGSSPLARGLRL